jgi:hypothetical protein
MVEPRNVERKRLAQHLDFEVGPGNYNVSVRYEAGTGPIHLEMDGRRLLIVSHVSQGEAMQFQRSVNVGRDGLRLVSRCGCTAGIPDVVLAARVMTVWLIGDSTVCDQKAEPWCSWGQVFPCFFRQGVAIVNRAKSGMSAQSFVNSDLITEALIRIKPGDCVCFQFGHNDQKISGDALSIFKQSLRDCILKTRQIGALPIIVTPVQRGYYNREGMRGPLFCPNSDV